MVYGMAYYINGRLNTETLAANTITIAEDAAIPETWTTTTTVTSSTPSGWDVYLFVGPDGLRNALDSLSYSIEYMGIPYEFIRDPKYPANAPFSQIGTLLPVFPEVVNGTRNGYMDALYASHRARSFTRPRSRHRVPVLLNCCADSSGFTVSAQQLPGVQHSWSALSGVENLLSRAIRRVNECLETDPFTGERHTAMHPNNRLAAIVCSGSVVDVGLSEVEYRDELRAFIATLRARVHGASQTTPYLMALPTPSDVEAYPEAAMWSVIRGLDVPTYACVDSAGLEEMNGNVANTAMYVMGGRIMDALEVAPVELSNVSSPADGVVSWQCGPDVAWVDVYVDAAAKPTTTALAQIEQQFVQLDGLEIGTHDVVAVPRGQYGQRGLGASVTVEIT